MKLYTYWRSLATFRVRIALNLKGLKYEAVYVDLDGGQQNKSDYKAVNPQMVIPSLVEDDGNMLYQSLAIMEYLERGLSRAAAAAGRSQGPRPRACAVADHGRRLASHHRAARAQPSGRDLQPRRGGQGQVGQALVRRRPRRLRGPPLPRQGHRPLLPWRHGDHGRPLPGEPRRRLRACSRARSTTTQPSSASSSAAWRTSASPAPSRCGSRARRRRINVRHPALSRSIQRPDDIKWAWMPCTSCGHDELG